MNHTAFEELDQLKRKKTQEAEDFENFHDRLCNITGGCRVDMHEPDEQGVSAVVAGYHLDNAFGDEPKYNEYVVVITNENTGKEECFNLATLIAVARMAEYEVFEKKFPLK